MNRVQIICIGHIPPLFKPRDSFTFVSPSQSDDSPNSLVIADNYLPLSNQGNTLSEYAQLFGLADALSQGDRFKHSVFLFQYRKFISLNPGPRKASNVPYAFVCSQREAERLFPDIRTLHHLGDKLLTGPIIPVSSIAKQYSDCHILEDFCAFISALTDSDQFSHERIKNFINHKSLIPAPSLGLFPVELFIDHMATLRQVWSIFANAYYEPREGYQRRVGGFLLERLHSFLISESLGNQPDSAVNGFQIILSKTKTVRFTH